MPTRDLGKEELANLEKVFKSGKLSVLQGGKMQSRFEQAFARAHGVQYAVAMNSAMSVLHAAVIVAGVQPGVEVICDPVCVFGSLAVLYQRGTPVFVDCQPVTLNMDPTQIEDKITERTKALIVTHIGGLPAEMDRIMKIARKYKLFVIEDCAHAFLATYKGKSAGSWGDVGSFSFQASKQLSTGDGGMAITNSKAIADALALHAGAPTFKATAYGVHYNYRMNETTAAVGLAQLPKIKKACKEVIKIARLWDAAISEASWLIPQCAPEGAQSTYHLWVATFDGEKYGISRVRFAEALQKHKLADTFSLGYTGFPAYRHPVYDMFPKGTYPEGLCPNAEWMIPRLIFGYPMISMERALRCAESWRALIKELS